MKPVYFLSALTLAFSITAPLQAQAASAIQPGSAILANLASQHNNATALQPGDILSDSQNAAGYQLTGELLLQLAPDADFTALAAGYKLQLKHSFGDIVVVTSQNINLTQLLAQLKQESGILQVSYDLRELGLSPDPEVKNLPPIP
ncbi:hypothetical protein MN202_06990 [Rheinheimera muenzenbergensis]|uniref:ASP external chaperone domain-containing protein n=1 Tax=Rheinheimera muenzenbergensis TaxID=1193628 RepID=A0ABU8C5B6_9GAMM